MSPRSPGILFVSHGAERTGAPIGLLAFMGWLRENTDYRLGTLLCTPGPLADEFRAHGPVATLGATPLTLTRLGRRVGRLLPRSVREETGRIRRAFRGGAYDLIYSSTITNGRALSALASFGVPVVTHVHELAYWMWRTGEENLRRALAHTHAFIAASRAVQDHLVEQHAVPAEKITLVYEHIRALPPVPTPSEKAAARRSLGLPADALVIGGCGAEPWRKGRDLIPPLLAALRRQSGIGEAYFVWVGRRGTPEEEWTFRYDLRGAGVEAFFRASGEVSDPASIFAAFDVFALLSREDPYPLACLEVAATEVPVACFDGAGGMPEFVRDGCGTVARYLDVEQMAQGIAALAGDPARLGACGRRARAKVLAESTLDATAPRLCAVIESQLKAHRHLHG